MSPSDLTLAGLAISYGTLLVGVVALLAAIAIAVKPRAQAGPRLGGDDRLLLLLCWLVIFAFRAPILATPGQLNVDESQMLAQALRFQVDIVPWRSVDGTTSGPLNSLLLALLALLGLPVSYASAHVVSAVCSSVALSLSFLTLRAGLPERAARLALLPALVFLALSPQLGFLHYSSEQLPVVLLAGAVLGLVGTGGGRARDFIAGALLGAAPFAKLQAAPIAAALAALGTVAFLADRGARADSRRRLVGLWLGVLTVPAIVLAVVTWAGALRDFWLSYVLLGVYHGGIWPGSLPTLLTLDHGVILLCLLALGTTELALWLALRGRVMIGEQDWHRFAAMAVYLGATLYAVAKPRNNFDHYLLLLVHPLTLLTGVSLAIVLRGPRPRLARLGRLAPPAIGFCVLSCGAALAAAAMDCSRQGLFAVRAGYLRAWARNLASRAQAAPSVVTSLIRLLAHSDGHFAIWGWAPQLYVETGLRPSTRDAIAQLAVTAGPLQAYYRERFLHDFLAARPCVFVDAVGPGNFFFTDRARLGHESFPALDRVIRGEYRLVHDQPDLEEGSVRIYVRTAVPLVPPAVPVRSRARRRDDDSSLAEHGLPVTE